MRKINEIIIHCSATKPNQDIGAKEIKEWHVNDNGWRDIGYHYVINRQGKIEVGRPENDAGAHARGRNSNSIGICLVGGIDYLGKPECNYTASQFDSLSRLVQMIKTRHPHISIIGHRDIRGVSKPCPCFNVIAWSYHQFSNTKGETE